MATLVEALKAGIKGAYCNSVANTPQWFGNLREILIGGAITDAADRLYCFTCGYCDGADNPPPPPFTGGQCAGVQYRINIGGTWQRLNQFGNLDPPESPSPTTLSPFLGPITECRTQVNSGARTITLELRNSGGGTSSTVIAAWSSGQTLAANNITLSIVRTDGAPDTCGDPPVTYPDPATITVNVNVDYTDEGDNNVSLTVPVIFAPFYVNLSGQLSIPISVDIGGLEFSGEMSLSPEFDITFDLTGGEVTGPGTVDDPDITPGDPDFDGEEPDVGPDPAIIAVVVRSSPTFGDRTTLIPDIKGPDILAPGVATVRFAVRAGGIVAWTADIRVKGVNEYVVCPAPQGAVDFSVRSEVGWSHSATAIRGEPLQPFS